MLGAGAPVSATVVGILAGDGPLPGDAGRTVVLGLETAASLNRPDDADPAATGTVTGLSRIDVVLAAGADAASVTAALESALTVEPYVLSTPSTSLPRSARRPQTSDRRWRCSRRSACSRRPS